MTEKRKIKVQKDNGEIEYIDVPTEKPKILHNILSDILLKKIHIVYNEIRDVMQSTTEPPMNLESFEIAFMCDPHPENSIAVWERIVRAYKKAIAYFSEDFAVKQHIYNVLLFNSMDALKDEEKEREDIKLIIDIYDKTK